MLFKRLLAVQALVTIITILGTTIGVAQEAETIRIAHNLPKSTATGIYFKTLAEQIEKNTADTSISLHVLLYPNGQLVNDTQMPDAISSGTVKIGGVNIDFVNQPAAQPLRIGELPFMFDSWKDLWATEDSAAYRKIFQNQFAKMGMHHIGWVPYGTVEFFAKSPIKVPSDLKGKRIRSFGVISSRLVQEVGAAPVSMSSQELYQALQRGAIDGFFSGPTSVYSRKLYEVVKHGTQANVIFLAFLAEANKQWWNGLPKDVRAAIKKSAQTAAKKSRVYVKQEVADADKKLRDNGVELVTLSPKERKTWVRATSGVVKEYKKNGGKLAQHLIRVVKETKSDEKNTQ